MILVTYDLRSPDRDYSNLIKAIRAYGNFAKPLESVWILDTNWTVTQVRDDLRQHIDGNDGLLVMGLTGNWAAVGLSEAVASWLKQKV